jgi:SHS2 domain-containing protein
MSARAERARSPGTGHRLVPHTADRIIEAWGPDLTSCLVEALTALVESFAKAVETTSTRRPLPLAAPPGRAEDTLIALVEQVIYAIDVFAAVPVGFRLEESGEGALTGSMDVVPVEAVALLGAPPKAVTYHGLSVAPTETGWRCRMLVDV